VRSGPNGLNGRNRALAAMVADLRGRLVHVTAGARALAEEIAHQVHVFRDVESRLAAFARLWHLTPDETDTLDHLVRGDANKDIAKAHGWSTRTAESQVERIRRKVGADSRARVVARFWGVDPMNGGCRGSTIVVSGMERLRQSGTLPTNQARRS
jgi:DNA-binding CsgD family transcriptional regulator